MSLLVANRGQTAKLAFTNQFTDATGAAADPTGSPALAIYYANAAGSLSLITTLTPTKQLTLLGFYGAYLDVSNTTTFPAGEYIARWTATVAGVAAAAQEAFQIQDAASFASVSPLATAYCTEAQIRFVLRNLTDTVNASSALVAEAAGRAASRLDSAFSKLYTVPFSLPAPAAVITLNAWLGAVLTMDNLQAEQGSRTRGVIELEKRVMAWIAEIKSGAEVLVGAAVATVEPDGLATSSSIDSTRTYSYGEKATPNLENY